MKRKQDAATLAEEFYNPSLSEYYKRFWSKNYEIKIAVRRSAV